MAPAFDKKSPALEKLFGEYREDHGSPPAIAFHTAVDALNMLQDYLDTHTSYNPEEFREYLLTSVKSYSGLMGEYSFDSNGNANIGFEMSVISSENAAS